MIFKLSLYLTENRESALLSCFIICCFEPLCFLVYSFMKVHPLEDFWLDPWHNHSCTHHWYHRNCCMCAFVSYQSWLDLGVEIFPGQDLRTYQVVLQYKLQEAAVLSSLFWTSYWKINIRKVFQVCGESSGEDAMEPVTALMERRWSWDAAPKGRTSGLVQLRGGTLHFLESSSLFCASWPDAQTPVMNWSVLQRAECVIWKLWEYANANSVGLVSVGWGTNRLKPSCEH